MASCAMTITADNFFSCPVALWLGAGAIIVILVCLATVRVHVMWQRVFFRTAVIALCFVPLPALEMFTEVAVAGSVAIVPLWYVLFWSIAHGAFLGLAVALIVWLVAAYLLWVVGMSIHRFLRRSHAA